MNKITLNFDTCTPAPARGYHVWYRVAGSTGMHTDAGNFFISPAVFYDTTNPAGTEYEGFISSDLGATDCNDIPWTTADSGGGGGDTVTIINGAGGFEITGISNLDGFVMEGPDGPGEPLQTGQQATGTHTQDGSTGICVDVVPDFPDAFNAHLSLYVNDILVQCIPNITVAGSNCFNNVTIVPTDEIRIELIVGAGC